MRPINFLSPILLLLLPFGVLGDGEDATIEDPNLGLVDCVEKTGPKLTKCDQDFEKVRQNKALTPQDVCDKMHDYVICYLQTLQKCGVNATDNYISRWFKPEINPSWCPLCKRAYDSLAVYGGHLYHENEDKKTSTYCNQHDYVDIPCLKSPEGEPRHFLSLCEAQYKGAMDRNYGDKEHYCSTMDYRIRCIFKEVWRYCDGNDKSMKEAVIAIAHLKNLSDANTFKVPSIAFCAYCEKVIQFLEEIVDSHLWVEGGRYRSYCDIFGEYMVKSNTTTTPAGALSSSTEFPTVTPTESGPCVKRNSVKKEIKECSGVQQTFLDPNNTCSHKFMAAKCVHDKVYELCGETDAEEYMKNLYITVMADDCPYCSDVVDYMEKKGGRVFKLYGKEEYCTQKGTPEPSPSPAEPLCPGMSTTLLCNGPQKLTVEGACNGIMDFLDCMYNEVRIGCDEETANDTIKETPVAVSDLSYCPFCNAAAMFLGKFGNVMKFYKGKDDSKLGACKAPEPKSCIDATAVTEKCTTKGDDTNPDEFCMAMGKELSCEFEEAKSSCGKDIAINYIKNKRVTVKREFCGSCALPVTRFLEAFGTHLYIEDEKDSYCLFELTPSTTSMATTVESTVKPSLSPQLCVEQLVNSGELSKTCANAKASSMTPYEEYCSNLYTFMTCVHGLISKTCDDVIAAQYVRKSKFFVTNSSYCPHCTKATEFTGKLGGFVYDSSDKSTPCAPKVPSCAEREEMISAITNCKIDHKAKSKLDSKEACDAMHKIARCINSKAITICGEPEAKEFMKRPILYIFPKLCAHCQAVAKYLERMEGHLYINVGLTRICHAKEADPTTTLGSSTTPSSSTASPSSATSTDSSVASTDSSVASTDSSTATSGSSTSNAEPGLPESLCPGVEFPPANCDKFQRVEVNKTETCDILKEMAMCIYGAIVDKCGHNIAMKYLKYVQFGVPDISYCLTCQEAVKFLLHMNIHLYDDRFDTNLTDAEGNCDTSLVPPTPEIPEPDNCADKTAMRNVNSYCTWVALSLSVPGTHVCKDMYDAAECIHKGAIDICGEDNATRYMTTPVLSVDSRYCADEECSKLIDHLEGLGGHLYTYGNSITMCEKGMKPPEPGPCKEIDTGIKNLECARMQIMPDIKDDSCDSLYKLVQCVYDRAVTKCGKETAERHIAHTVYGIPNPSYCPACESVVKYLKKLGSHLYDYSTSDKQLCEVLTTTVAPPTVPLITSDITVETKQSEPTTMSTKPVTTTAPVAATTPSIDDCLNKGKDNIDNCKKAYDASSKEDTGPFINACKSVLEYISCLHEAVYAVCGEKNTHTYMEKHLKIAVDPEWCPDCTKAIDYTGGPKLYIRDSNGNPTEHHCKERTCCMSCKDLNVEVKKCEKNPQKETPQEACKRLNETAQCAHESVTKLCLVDKANSYLKKSYSVKVTKSECPFCSGVVDYMKGFGGLVYYDDGKTVCDPQKETPTTESTTKNQPSKAPLTSATPSPKPEPHVPPAQPTHPTDDGKLDTSSKAGSVLSRSVPVIYILWIFFTFFV